MKKLFNSLKIIGIAAALAVGVSYVSAYTPIATPPNPNVPAPIHIGTASQTKIGSFTTASFLKAGVIGGIDAGWIIGKNSSVSPWQFFKNEYLPGTDSQMKVGSDLSGRTASPLPSVDKTKFNPKDDAIPLTIDLIGRGTGNTSVGGTHVMDLHADANFCNSQTTIRTDTAGIEFRSTTTRERADVIARQIQLNDPSSAGAMKVLVATDDKGNATWGTLSIVTVDGVKKVQVNYNGQSAVAAGQACGAVPTTTYAWDSGTWGTCSSSYPSDWVDFVPAPSTLTWGSQNQSCSSWINAQNNNYKTGSQTRDVVCKDSNGATVNDSFCTGTKPTPTQACTVPLQYRDKLANISGTGTTNYYTNSGYCLYGKLQNPGSTDPFGNIFADDCKTVKMTDPVPAGYSPVSFCGKIVGTGGGNCASFGFNAGAGTGTCTIEIGSANMNLQVKKQ